MGLHRVHEYGAGKLDWLAAGLPTEGENNEHPRAHDVARKQPPTCRLDERVGDVRSRARAAGWDVAVVVDAHDVVLGFMRGEDLAGDAGLAVEKAMKAGPSTFRPYVTIKEMADYMTEHDLESAPITTSDGRLAGVLFRDDAVREAADCPHCERKLI